MEDAFIDRLQDHLYGGLDHTITDRCYSQRSHLAIGFRDIDAFDRLRAVGLRQEFLS